MKPADNNRGFHELVILIAAHFLVDTIAGMVSPLWPDIEARCGFAEGGTFWLLMIWMISTSLTQLLFGLMGESSAGRWLLWCGPMMSALCLAAIATTTTPLTAGGLLMAGGIGIAAFHPEAATRAGNCLPGARSRAMSLFSTAGFVGQSVGPAISGLLVAQYGLSGLSIGTGTALVVLLVLALSTRLPRRQKYAAEVFAQSSPWTVLQQNYRVVGLLLAAGVLRVIPASGIPVATAYWLKLRHLGSDEIGMVQSAFMFGIGLGGLIAAVWITHRTERLTLTTVPLAAVPCLLVFQTVSQNLLLVAMFGAGLTLGMAQPVFISLGQQLLSANRRFGSSITMGVSWGIGGVVVAALTDYCDRQQNFGPAFTVYAVCIMASCALCLRLPPAHSESTAG
jgi:FSR family fosmidomycin resistance protein-like MFS transporter